MELIGIGAILNDFSCRVSVNGPVETLKERKFLSLFNHFYEKYFSYIKPLIFYKSLSELRQDLRKSNSKLFPFTDRMDGMEKDSEIKDFILCVINSSRLIESK